MKLLNIKYKICEEEFSENSCDSEIIFSLNEFHSLNLIPLYDLLTNNLWGYNMSLEIGGYRFWFLCSLKRDNSEVRNVKELYEDLFKFLNDTRKFLEITSNKVEFL